VILGIQDTIVLMNQEKYTDTGFITDKIIEETLLLIAIRFFIAYKPK
jgi:hypothetical protein